jgi:hypothetical protein
MGRRLLIGALQYGIVLVLFCVWVYHFAKTDSWLVRLIVVSTSLGWTGSECQLIAIRRYGSSSSLPLQLASRSPLVPPEPTQKL